MEDKEMDQLYSARFLKLEEECYAGMDKKLDDIKNYLVDTTDTFINQVVPPLLGNHLNKEAANLAEFKKTCKTFALVFIASYIVLAVGVVWALLAR